LPVWRGRGGGMRFDLIRGPCGGGLGLVACRPQRAELHRRCSAISGQFPCMICIRIAYEAHCINKKGLAANRRKSFHRLKMRETGFEPAPLSGLDPKSETSLLTATLPRRNPGEMRHEGCLLSPFVAQIFGKM